MLHDSTLRHLVRWTAFVTIATQPTLSATTFISSETHRKAAMPWYLLAKTLDIKVKNGMLKKNGYFLVNS